jgi:phospholipase C
MQRLFLLAIAALAASSPFVVLASCSSSSSKATGADAAGPCATSYADDGGLGPDGEVLTPCAWNQPVTQPSESTAGPNRTACKYTRGDMPMATLGSSVLPADIPIDNVVVVMMENHSFDNYLGHLNQYGNRSDVETASADASNPGADGGAVAWVHEQHPCTADTDHEWAGTHQEVDNGKMDGFVTTNDGHYSGSTFVPGPADGGSPALYNGARAMGYYDQTDLPFYYQLANTFAVADHYHCAVQGPTWPNRMYLLAATSFGETTNVFPDISAYPFPSNDATLLDELEKRHVTWELYGNSLVSAEIIYTGAILNRWGRPVKTSFTQFQQDAKMGNLPQVAFVDPDLSSETNGGAGTDEHPPGDIQSGEVFVSQVVQAVMTSPQWAHTALFITHDENGGFYDHVPPPPACAPDMLPPKLAPGDTTDAGFDAYGIRVLLVAVSPYAKKGYVGHQVYDHTSIARFIEAKFQLPALTARDANALPPTDLFDFTDPPAFATPPSLMTPTIDPTQLSYCESTFGN